MDTEQKYQELKDLAEKLDVVVAEQNLKISGFKVKSGYCLVKDRKHCIIDKHLKVWQKIDILAKCLAGMPIEDIFIVPAIRELLERHRAKKAYFDNLRDDKGEKR